MLTLSRRGLLKAGLLGSAALVTGTSLATLSGCSRQPDRSRKLMFLRQHDTVFLSALAPVILKNNYPGSLGKGAEERLIKALDGLMFTLGEYSQNELRQLFDLMALGPARFMAGGPLVSWDQASSAQIEGFLYHWRDSLFLLKRMGYNSLTKLITTSWYAMPENHIQAGYPGPPKKYSA